MHNLGGGFTYFLFSPLGEDCHFDSFFQLGWTHQLDYLFKIRFPWASCRGHSSGETWSRFFWIGQKPPGSFWCWWKKSVEVCSLSHYLQQVFFNIPGGDGRISEPSTVSVSVYLFCLVNLDLKLLFCERSNNSPKAEDLIGWTFGKSTIWESLWIQQKIMYQLRCWMLGLSDKIREILSSGKMVVSIKESICMKHNHASVPNKIQLLHFSEKDEKNLEFPRPNYKMCHV